MRNKRRSGDHAGHVSDLRVTRHSDRFTRSVPRHRLRAEGLGKHIRAPGELQGDGLPTPVPVDHFPTSGGLGGELGAMRRDTGSGEGIGNHHVDHAAETTGGDVRQAIAQRIVESCTWHDSQASAPGVAIEAVIDSAQEPLVPRRVDVVACPSPERP